MTTPEPDACPGALTLHAAVDGPLARVRVPGGMLTPAQVETLARSAAELGDGTIELTSRGNIQLRAVTDADRLAERLTGAGLLPSATHERVRNIVASPLSGRIGGLVDVRPLVPELDEGLCALPASAALPGRVLFAMDDGRGDVSALRPDFGLQAVPDDTMALVLAGVDTGVRVTADGVAVLLAAAAAFDRIRDGAWRLADVPDGVARVSAELGLEPTVEPLPVPAPGPPPVGWLTQDDGAVALGAGVRFGTLDARLAEFVAAVEHPIVITPWRGLIIADMAEDVADTVLRVLAPMGLIFDAESPWLLVSACVGQPNCAKAQADVRAEATASVERGEVHERQHWSGCERRCGRPPGVVLEHVADTANGG